MADLRQAAKQALEALEAMEPPMMAGYTRRLSAITALRAALEQPEPAAYGYASRLAVAIWEKHYKATAVNWKPFPDLMGVLTQIDNMTAGLTRQQVEQEQEPVAHSVQSPDDAKRNRITPSLVTDTRQELEEYLGNSEAAKHIVPIYAHPPRREWRSLSEEEVHQMASNTVDAWECARAVKAKLKERNA
jgi:hypothetical protein